MNDIILDKLKALIPPRDPDGNKGTFGTLTIIAGSEMYRGAAVLPVSAALRCGVGLVRLASTEKVIAAAAAQISECIYLPLPENGVSSISHGARELLSGVVGKSSAVLVGSGMISCEDTAFIVRYLLENAPCGLVIDADGLNSISAYPDVLRKAKSKPIITPHIGEMSRLTGKGIDDIKSNRLETAVEFSNKYSCITVLKDCVTVIASPDDVPFICDRKNSGLAKGGSGDVLAGIIAALSAQMPPYDAAVAGVILHSLAAREAAEQKSEYSMLPTDIINCIPSILKEVQASSER